MWKRKGAGGSLASFQADHKAFHTAGVATSLMLVGKTNLPLRMQCISAVPAIVTVALSIRLNPSMTLILALMFR